MIMIITEKCLACSVQSKSIVKHNEVPKHGRNAHKIRFVSVNLLPQCMLNHIISNQRVTAPRGFYSQLICIYLEIRAHCYS